MRVVAQHRVGIQRQMIAVQVDVIGQQGFQPIAFHAAHRRRFVFPKIPVMHQDGVRLLLHRRIQ
ncbi:hypothetical protein D3C75_1360030 [compost metagenome]